MMFIYSDVKYLEAGFEIGGMGIRSVAKNFFTDSSRTFFCSCEFYFMPFINFNASRMIRLFKNFKEKMQIIFVGPLLRYSSH